MESIVSRNQQLRKKISDIEESLSTLKEQLKKQEEKAQHDAIDNLESYLEQVDNKCENFSTLWTMVREEIQELFKKGPGHESNKGGQS